MKHIMLIKINHEEIDIDQIDIDSTTLFTLLCSTFLRDRPKSDPQSPTPFKDLDKFQPHPCY